LAEALLLAPPKALLGLAELQLLLEIEDLLLRRAQRRLALRQLQAVRLDPPLMPGERAAQRLHLLRQIAPPRPQDPRRHRELEEAVARAPQLQLAQLPAVSFIALGLLRLLAQRPQPPLKLADHVAHPQQVLLGLLDPALRRLLLRLKAGDPGRLVEHRPSVLGLRRDDLPHLPLLDDRVAPRARACP
jgi:hypothetical protein